MVIDVLVYIEGSKDVERVAEVYLPRNSCITFKDWEKVSGTDNRVHMYDGHNPILFVVEIGFDNPHPVVRVRVVEGFGKLVNERTRKKIISNLEREKQMDPRNIQTPHPWHI